jgi:hypothetical protein
MTWTINGEVFLTANEVAARYRITTRTLHTWIKRKRINQPTVRKGRRLWKLSELERDERWRKALWSGPLVEMWKMVDPRFDPTLPLDQWPDPLAGLKLDFPDISDPKPEFNDFKVQRMPTLNPYAIEGNRFGQRTSDEEKRRVADFIVDSSQTFDHTRAQIRDFS